MRIAIVGTGGIGSLYGARLAKIGADVVFVARGSQYEALKAHGLHIIGGQNNFVLNHVNVVKTVANIGVVDVVLLCVKTYDVVDAARDLVAVIGENAIVIPIQNGVESHRIVSEFLGPERVIAGCVLVSSHIESPGVVRQTATYAAINFGEPRTNACRDAILRFSQLCTLAGITSQIFADVDAMLWTKFVRIAANSAITAITRQSLGSVLGDPVLVEVYERALDEVFAIAKVMRINLAIDLKQSIWEAVLKLPPEWKSSLLIDLERGKRLEIDVLSGAVHRIGKDVGVATPVHTTAYAALKPFANPRGIRLPLGT